MAWQRTGCSHDGGMNVLGQMPIDYGDSTPRGPPPSKGPKDLSPGGGNNDNDEDYGGYGRRPPPAGPADDEDKGMPSGAALDALPAARYSVEESLNIMLESMSQRKDRYGQPVGKLGLKELRKKFILFDDTKEERDEGKAMLNWNEFFTGMEQQQGFIRDPAKKLNKRELFNLFNHCDIDGSGNLDMREFMFNIINVALPQSCQTNVKYVFEAMDANNTGYIDVQDIKRLYRVDQNPDVKNLKLTEEEAFAQYIQNFEPDFLDGKKNIKDNKISHEEWMDYYCGIFREYCAGFGKAPAVNAFNTLIKTTYRDTGKVTKDAFGEGMTYEQMNKMKGSALQY